MEDLKQGDKVFVHIQVGVTNILTTKILNLQFIGGISY